jgi:hypothetical protein
MRKDISESYSAAQDNPEVLKRLRKMVSDARTSFANAGKASVLVPGPVQD